MNFISNEFYRVVVVFSTRPSIYLVPLFFIVFCLILKGFMISQYTTYFENHSQDIFASLVTTIYEKHIGKMDKITFWGTIILLLTLYKKYRKNIF